MVAETGEMKKPADNRVGRPSVWRRYVSQAGIVGVGLAMWLAFVLAAPEVFTNINIYLAFAQTTPQFGIIAIALTFVVITGEIDLSFPSIMALGTAVFCLLAQGGTPWPVALVAAFATGAFCGWINGTLVAWLNIPSLVITIGTSFLFRGIELVMMDGTGVPLTAQDYPEMHAIFRSSPFGIPVQTLWMIVILIGAWFLLNRTRFGAHVFLVGDNPTSARLMGINAVSVKTKAFMLVGVGKGSSSTPSPRCSSAARACSAAPGRSWGRSSPPTSSARSTQASSRPGSTPSTRSSPSGS